MQIVRLHQTLSVSCSPFHLYLCPGFCPEWSFSVTLLCTLRCLAVIPSDIIPIASGNDCIMTLSSKDGRVMTDSRSPSSICVTGLSWFSIVTSLL